jgi:hypothetical protein
MRIIYLGTNAKITECVEFANSLWLIDEFWIELNSKDKFTFTELPTPEIVQRVKLCEEIVTIKTYTPKWPWSNANAYITPKYKNTLYLNNRKLFRKQAAIINTIIHECVHVADYGDDDNQITFGHGDNYPKGKENSAPYWIGEQAAKFFELSTLESPEVEKVDIDEMFVDE